MPQLILHHFDFSPFAEKARLLMGFKALAWSSVQIPMVMPKPELMPLTGGYRKTPVLQIGADIYCDTRLIARELERRYPSPTLFPGDSRGIALALSHWSDTALFEPGAGLSMAMTTQVPEAVLADRREFFTFMDFSKLAGEVPHLSTQLRANAHLIEEQLTDGSPYLLGDACGWADITSYFAIWMARTFVPAAEQLLAANVHTQAWEGRMRAIGHGARQDIEAATALKIARNATPDAGRGVDAADPLGLVAGELVSATPADYGKVAVTGKLVTLDIEEVAVQREDPQVGTVVTHFPRLGYRLARC